MSEKEEVNLKTFPKLPYRKDSIHLGSNAQFLSYIAKTINWKEDFEASIPHKITRLKDDLTMFIRDYNLPSILYPQLFKIVDEWNKKEILG